MAPADNDAASIEPAERSDLYALAARVFAAEVDEEFYGRLTSAELRRLCEAGGFALVEPELAALGAARALEELAVEYCRLFVGPGPLCPPFASAVLGEALLGGRMRGWLEAFLDRHALAAPPMRVASPDHVAVELAILAQLHADIAARDRGDGDGDGDGEVQRAAAREFLRDHALRWMEPFLEKVARTSGRALYRSTAQLTLALLGDERAQHHL